jgi:transcriptional regulator with XRE-family HTH domain
VPDIGNSLREARIRRGLSINDVEAVTRIRSKYLQALEENDFEVIPGPTFVKGFLRTYALFLKLDADLILSEYRSTYEPRGDEVATLRTDLTQQPRSRTATERKRKRTRRTQRGYVLAGVAAVVLVALLAWFGAGRGDEAASLESDNLNPPTSTSLVDSASVSTTTTGENVVFVVNVTEGSCWLVIREDSEQGAELYAGTLSAGGQQTFDGAKRYWMMAGRPEVLAITVNAVAFTVAPPAGSFTITEAGIERNP